MLSNMSSIQASRQPQGLQPSPSAQDGFAVKSERVLDRSTVPGVGSFTAYEDGRIRAQFEDRTIMHVNASHSHCKAILPDGKSCMVACSNPVGMEQYVTAVFDFARWAFKTGSGEHSGLVVLAVFII